MKHNLKITLTAFCLLIFVFWACNNNSSSDKKNKGNTAEQNADYKTKGANIAEAAQINLLKNVTAAIQKGGTEHAIGFCNLKAGGLTDSLSKVFNCDISRISYKNRNPQNRLSSATDLSVWVNYERGNQDVSKDTVCMDTKTNKTVYYKPIKIAMPTCLKCHGKAGEDIEEKTLSKINELYPKDLAKEYKMGDLRGLWKITFD